MLPMRLLRARRKSGGSRAVARVRFPFRTAPLFAGTPLRCKGPPGRFRGFGGASAVPAPCPVLRAPLRLRHPHPVLRASLRLRVLSCGLLCGSGIRTLSCARLCGGVCFSAGPSATLASAPCPAGSSAAAARVLCCSSLCGTCGRPSAPSVSPVLRPVRATRCGCRLLRSLRPASASRFSHRRPGFPPRFGDPASRLAPAPRYLCSSGRGGRDRPVRIRPPPVRRRTPAAGAASRPCRAFSGSAAGANRR